MDFLNTDEKRNRRLVHLPMGRFGEAVEVAKGALFRKSSGSRSHARPHAVRSFTRRADDACDCAAVASDDSSYMTGTDFKVDGGLTSCYVTPLGEPILPPPSSLA